MKTWLLYFFFFLSNLSFAGEFRLAAAASLQPVAQALSKDFNQQTGHTFQTSFGASGKLFAQISHGAPFDVLMSADMKYPQALIQTQSGHAPVIYYANGVLVLWTTQSSIPKDWQSWLKSNAVQKIAMAQPDSAPYGREALRVVSTQKLLPALQSKLVYGESIAQTSQFISTGAAQAGFTAKSIVANPEQKPNGTWLEIPQAMHQPITQGAVLTSKGKDNAAAKAFMTYLQSPAAQGIFRRYGFLVPAQ